MALLRERGLDVALRASQVPVLGICLGMQLLYEGSEEGDVACLRVIPGWLARMSPVSGARMPHMGWNTLRAPVEGESLLQDIDDGSADSFVHRSLTPMRFHSTATVAHARPLCAVVHPLSSFCARSKEPILWR